MHDTVGVGKQHEVIVEGLGLHYRPNRCLFRASVRRVAEEIYRLVFAWVGRSTGPVPSFASN